MPIGRSYVSRVQVKGKEGAEWMTVPIQRAEGQWINAVHFADRTWARKHLGKMRANYGRCPFFESVLEIVRPIYEDPGEFLAPFNVRLIRALAHYVGLTPRFYLASELKSGSTGTHRLIDIVHDVGGTTYVSGVGGIKYQDPAAFKAAGIDLDVVNIDRFRTNSREILYGIELARCCVSCRHRGACTTELLTTHSCRDRRESSRAHRYISLAHTLLHSISTSRVRSSPRAV